MKFFDQIVNDIRIERENQLQKWSLEHDQQHAARDWLALIGTYATKLLADDSRNNYRRFIQIAAICIAAIEVILTDKGGKNGH